MADRLQLPTHELHPRILTLWRLGSGAACALVVGFVALSLALNEVPRAVSFGVPVALGALGAALTVAVPRMRYRRWRYEIRERDVFLSKGTLVQTIALLPLDRIQMVKTTQGPLDRRFSLMQLVISTAAGKESIPGLTIPEAERLRAHLSDIAGSASV